MHTHRGTKTSEATGTPAPSPTRISASWTFVAIAIVVLVVVLVFILENLHATDATFFGLHWRIPLGIDLLLAALLGAAAVFIVGAARIVQLRFINRSNQREDASVPPAAPPETPVDTSAE